VTSRLRSKNNIEKAPETGVGVRKTHGFAVVFVKAFYFFQVCPYVMLNSSDVILNKICDLDSRFRGNDSRRFFAFSYFLYNIVNFQQNYQNRRANRQRQKAIPSFGKSKQFTHSPYGNVCPADYVFFRD